MQYQYIYIYIHIHYKCTTQIKIQKIFYQSFNYDIYTIDKYNKEKLLFCQKYTLLITSIIFINLSLV